MPHPVILGRTWVHPPGHPVERNRMKYVIKRFSSKRLVMMLAASFALAALIGSSVLAGAYPNSVTYSGQGLTADGFGGYDLNRELCGIANGADADGPYLLWVLTATGASNADITGPWGTALMTKTGNGTFKYISGFYDPSTLPGNVSATYDGKAKNTQLVISHGCRPFKEGAWCSPGFWRNARDGAWALIGVDRDTTMFNGNVSLFYFGADLDPDVALQTVLNNAPTYSGSPVQGTGVACPLNAFNATGAFLTDKIPGFQFDCSVMLAGGSDACPIDSFGHFKQ